ncbi:hypothetical protein VTP01DRAFT_10308, partial [Rhizomucor pusillus]|uniref:uncharacterized protein n=1 Tax=Rhizomucor pusillus TaxID=4840 RepID=UPI003742E41E
MDRRPTLEIDVPSNLSLFVTPKKQGLAYPFPINTVDDIKKAMEGYQKRNAADDADSQVVQYMKSVSPPCHSKPHLRGHRCLLGVRERLQLLG